jgi:hypothetical protein
MDRIELHYVEGPRKGEIEAFRQPSITIGRAPDCHLVFPNERGTSAHHAVIRNVDGRFELFDSHSTNGTFVNDMRIQHTTLEDGDVIRFGVFGPQVRVRFPPPAELPGPVPDLLDAPRDPPPAPARPVARTIVHDVAQLPGARRAGWRRGAAVAATLAVALGLVLFAVWWWIR